MIIGFLSKVHTIAGSGVGGGSLVYTNVTEEPDESVLDSWDTQLKSRNQL